MTRKYLSAKTDGDNEKKKFFLLLSSTKSKKVQSTKKPTLLKYQGGGTFHAFGREQRGFTQFRIFWKEKVTRSTHNHQTLKTKDFGKVL